MEDNLQICFLEEDLNLFEINLELNLTILTNVRKQHFLLEAVKRSPFLKRNFKFSLTLQCGFFIYAFTKSQFILF